MYLIIRVNTVKLLFLIEYSMGRFFAGISSYISLLNRVNYKEAHTPTFAVGNNDWQQKGTPIAGTCRE